MRTSDLGHEAGGCYQLRTTDLGHEAGGWLPVENHRPRAGGLGSSESLGQAVKRTAFCKGPHHMKKN